MAQPELAPNIEISKAYVPREWRHSVSSLNDYIIGNPNDQMQTRTLIRK